MPGLVVDTSVTLPWCFKDEVNPYSELVFSTLESRRAVTTALWPFEVANALAIAEARGRVTRAGVDDFLDRLWRLPIQIEVHPALWICQETLALARRLRVTAYDASYLALAQRMNLPLATSDERMRVAAAELGVPLFESIPGPALS